MASDGLWSDRVFITWSPVSNAVEYRVYRSTQPYYETAEAISSWTSELYFDDEDAKPPTITPPVGCAGIPHVTFHEYYYWVIARNSAGLESDPQAQPDVGFVGPPPEYMYLFDQYVTEKTLPAIDPAAGERIARPDAELSLRLQSFPEDPVDPDTVWAQVRSSVVETTAACTWRQVSDADGWVVCRPGAGTTWPTGETLVMVAGANTVSGEPLGPVSTTFRVIDGVEKATGGDTLRQPSYAALDMSQIDTSAEAMDVALSSASGVIPRLVGGFGQAWRIGPCRPYETAQRVWLPIPDGVAASDLTVYYYHTAETNAGWYPAEKVNGWLVEDTYMTVDIDGTSYLGFLVSHPGIVQLGPVPTQAPLDGDTEASMFAPFTANGPATSADAPVASSAADSPHRTAPAKGLSGGVSFTFSRTDNNGYGVRQASGGIRPHSSHSEASRAKSTKSTFQSSFRSNAGWVV